MRRGRRARGGLVPLRNRPPKRNAYRRACERLAEDNFALLHGLEDVEEYVYRAVEMLERAQDRRFRFRFRA